MSEAKPAKAGKLRNVAGMGFGYFVNSAQEVSLSVLSPAIKQSFSPALTNANLATIDGARVVIQSMISPLWGMASERFSRKKVLVAGTGLWGGLVVLCGFSTEYWHLLASWIVACLGIGALVPAGFSLLADLYGPHERGKAIGILNAIGMSGLVAGALGLGALMGVAERDDTALTVFTAWRYAFFVVGGLSVMAGVVIALAVKEPPRGAAEPELDDVISDLAASRFRFQPADIKAIMRNGTVLLAFVQGFFVLTALFLIQRFFVVWMVEERGFANSEADLVFGLIIIGLVAGSLAGGVAADRAERRSPGRGRAVASQLSLLMVIPAIAVLVLYGQTLAVIIPAALVIAFFVEWTRRAALQPMVQNVMPPELRGTALALAEFFQGGLGSVAVIGLAHYSDRFSLGAAMLYGGCGCLLTGVVIAFGFYVTYPRDSKRIREMMAERRSEIEKASPGG